MAKKARVIITNRRGRHPSGSAEHATMELRAGTKGKGRKLYACHYWPWSGRSVEAAEGYIYAAAQRLGYEVVWQ